MNSMVIEWPDGYVRALVFKFVVDCIGNWIQSWAGVCWIDDLLTILHLLLHHCCTIVCILHQQNVKWFGSHNSTTQLFQTATPILPEAPRRSRTGWMQNDVLLRYSESTSGAPQRSWSSGTEYKNILKSMKSSSECYKIMPLSWQNFGAAGTTTLVSKTIPVHLEPDTPGVINI